ncbi:hypothetical protein T484DRAFT_1759172 [Baffinella frigidus]|nr:hypothetical protein T484DRAFT_1759172 [Cryptophyta sp. CCMP2293]
MLKAAQAVADGVRLACSLVDRPPMDMTPTALADAAKAVAVEIPGVVVSEHIVGENLRDKGYGGIWGVGKAGECPPSLLVLSYDPPGAIETVCLVGKGITYDTGGLSLKSKDGMPGMKHDMGGAAGMIGGFYAAAKLGCKQRIHLILCIAENAIGPTAFRNDDILTMFSGKTVGVPGRLVLGDGVAHATKLLRPNLVIDMATLTGAQLVATGKKHAGVLANSEELERKAVAAGLRSGDFCFPLLYAPELLFPEFKSEVADMKNSVKDRGNAQSSCAGHFIEKHLAADYTGGWLHIDMAGPGTKDQRATGYGVGLVLALLDAPGFS